MNKDCWNEIYKSNNGHKIAGHDKIQNDIIWNELKVEN